MKNNLPDAVTILNKRANWSSLVHLQCWTMVSVPGLSYGVVCVILGLGIFVELQLVTDRQTDGETQDDSIYHASIASCCKNVSRDTREVLWRVELIEN